MHVRLAALDDLDDVLSVLDDAAAWLQSIGVTQQWPASFSQDAAWVGRFGRWINDGRVYVARNDEGAALGCFRLMPTDNHIWADDDGRNVYLHSLAIVRSAAGVGLAKTMLDWAFELATSQGAAELRLDCWAGNERLVRYYSDAGFESRGTERVVEGESEYWVAKFARRCRPQNL